MSSARQRIVVALSVLGLAGASAGAAGLATAQTAQDVLPPGAYPVGTVLKGVCQIGGTEASGGPDQITTRFQIYKNGAWDPPADSENSAGDELTDPADCTERIDDPGLWRIYVTDYHWQDGSRTITYYGPYKIGGTACNSDEAAITSVSTASGAPTSLSALAGSHMFVGQTITADQDVELQLGDGSLLRITKGSSFGVDSCAPIPKEHNDWKVDLGLFLGKIWAKIAPNSGQHQFETPCTPTPIDDCRKVAGVRGTILQVSFTKPNRTVVQAIKDSVTLQRAGRGGFVGKQWTLKAGQTATWVGTKAPVIKRG
jgi:hypothetical protein